MDKQKLTIIYKYQFEDPFLPHLPKKEIRTVYYVDDGSKFLFYYTDPNLPIGVVETSHILFLTNPDVDKYSHPFIKEVKQGWELYKQQQVQQNCKSMDVNRFIALLEE